MKKCAVKRKKLRSEGISNKHTNRKNPPQREIKRKTTQTQIAKKNIAKQSKKSTEKKTGQKTKVTKNKKETKVTEHNKKKRAASKKKIYPCMKKETLKTIENTMKYRCKKNGKDKNRKKQKSNATPQKGKFLPRNMELKKTNRSKK